MAVTILLILFLVTLTINAFLGLTRSLNKSLIRLMTLIPAVILTFLLTGPITDAIAGGGLGDLLADPITNGVNNSGAAPVLSKVPLLVDALAAVPALILSIVILPLVFFALRFLTWIIYLLVQKPLRRLIFKDRSGEEMDENGQEQGAVPSVGVRIGKRFAGMGVGILSGLLSFGVLFAPIFGLFSMLPASNTVENTLDVMTEHGVLTRADADGIESAYAVTDCVLVKFYESVGSAAAGRAVLNNVTDLELNGQAVHPADELEAAMGVICTVLEGGLVDAALNKEDPAALIALLSDEPFMDALMQDLFRSRLLCSAVPNLVADAMDALASSLDVPADGGAVRAQMFDEIERVIRNAHINYTILQAYEGSGSTEEFYLAELSKLDKLSQTLTVLLDRYIAGEHEEFAACMADCIIADIRTRAVQSGNFVFDKSRLLSGIDPAALSVPGENVEELFAQFSDPDLFKTDLPTVESIHASVHRAVSDAIGDEVSASNTASTLAGIVSDFADLAVSAASGNDELAVADMNFENIADAVTQLQNSALKPIGSSLLDIFAAGKPGNNRMVREVLYSVKEGYENGEDISGLTETAGSLIGLASSMATEDRQAQEESVEGLILNLNDDTVDLLVSLLSDDVFAEMGIHAEYASSSRAVFETLLTELAALEGSEDYQNEVNSTLLLLKIITSDSEGLSSEEIADLADCARSSDAIFNTLVGISDSNPFGIQIADPAARESIIAAIDDFYAAGGGTDREREICRAVAALMGLAWGN